MAQRKVTLVWDDEKHPIVEQGIKNRPLDENITQYLRKCVEAYEVSEINDNPFYASLLEKLTIIEHAIRTGSVIPYDESNQTNQEQEDLFDSMLEQME